MKADNYSRIGMSAMLAGMQHLADMINAEVTRFKQQTGMQRWDRPLAETKPAKPPKERRKRPPKPKHPPYWAAMTKRERSEEMRRRIQKGKQRKANGSVAEQPTASLQEAIKDIRQIEWRNNTAEPQV